MNVNQEYVCKLCFNVINDKFEKINEITRQIFDVLLLNVNLDITENAIICQDCAEKTLKSFYFKSLCMDTEKRILSFAVDKPQCKVSLKDIYSLEAMDDVDLSICRFCLNQLKCDFMSMDFIMSEAEFLEMLSLFLPEMDFNISRIPIICMPCRENLEYHLKFMRNCFNTGQRIDTYCQGDEISGQLKAEFIFNEVCDGSIKMEECDIKEDYITTEGASQTYKCTTCSFLTKHETELVNHMVIHRPPSKLNVYKCEICTYETKNKQLLNKHLLTHKDASEVTLYKCEVCNFKTRYKAYLKPHMLNHKDVSEVNIYKCTSCSYETRHKSYLNAHLKIHKEVLEVKARKTHLNVFKCATCAFQTKYRNSIKSHLFTHKGYRTRSAKNENNSEMKMYKCYMCSYETVHEKYMKIHLMNHKNYPMTRLFKCDICSFKTKQLIYMKQHMLCHSYRYNGKMYKCGTCTYQTKRMFYIAKHMQTHSPPDVLTYKCMNCAYETNDKQGIQNHMATHKATSKPGEMYKYEIKREDKLAPDKGGLEITRIYLCPICNYETKNRKYLMKHLLIHKDPSEVEMFKCALCSFETKRKNSLKNHLALHKPGSKGTC